MRTQQLALAAVLTAAALSANAAQNRMEPVSSPFTYEALGATPTLAINRVAAPKAVDATTAVEAPKTAAVTKAAAPQVTEAPKAAPASKAAATTRAAAASSPFTYDTLGATPHVEVKKQPAKSEVQAPAAAH